MKILTIEPYPNYHFRSIIDSLNDEKISIKKIFFNDIPSFRKGDEWKVDPSEFRGGYFQSFKDIILSDVPIFLGIYSPFPKMLIFFIFACLVKKKVFVASEGFKSKSRTKMIFYPLFLILSKICNITFLCIGNRSNEDYYSLGFKQSRYLKFAFSERYDDYSVEEFSDDLKKYEDSRFNILLIGQLIKRKNFGAVIKACKDYSIHNSNKIIHVHIAGEGPELHELKKLASESDNILCNFHGHVSKSVLRKLFRESHLFILPSLYEGWGVVQNNAIHYGLPCLCFNTVRSGKDFLVEDSINGVIINSENISSAINYFLDMPVSEIQAYALNSYALKSTWSVEEISSRLRTILIDSDALLPVDGPLSIYKIR
ncbi:glycosyltransferase [Vibrio cyclitrophicus]|uniref:glycosyltransferase n=1 Tax=Vibrio cyclitrophicus TaxID=47951 RepID=UPI000C853624|nr:glycosyltransferase [Vibrio cyclitrophicus]PMJ45304.1 hypothetical protein BCU22_22360 [Vibrio cyclitrophicus]